MSETYTYKMQECDDDIDAIKKLCEENTLEESKKYEKKNLKNAGF